MPFYKTIFATSLLLSACGTTDDTADNSDANPIQTVQSATTVDAPVLFPESAVWDPASRTWFVSSFGQAFDPSGATPDAPGFITRLDEDGAVITARLVESTGDFLGLAMLDGTLYAAHGSDVWAIDPDSGEHSAIAFPNAGFLNDVAASDDALYVTDTGAGQVLRYVPGEAPTVFSTDPLLAAPNGITLMGETVYVATLGAFPPNPETPGTILTLDADGAATPVGELTGLFDGIAPIGDALVVTDIRGTLWRVDADGAAVTLADLAQFNLGSANDFGVRPDTRTLMVADLGSNALWSLQLD